MDLHLHYWLVSQVQVSSKFWKFSRKKKCKEDYKFSSKFLEEEEEERRKSTGEGEGGGEG